MLNADSIRKHKVASADKQPKEANDLAENMRYLCNQKPSISEVCRDLQINRQQFNKYLSGVSRPSSANLSKICRYFKCEEVIISLPHAQFIQYLEQPPQQSVTSDSQHLLNLLETAYPKADPELMRYLGFYHVYCHSMGFPGYIAKSLAQFYIKDDRMFCKTIERMSKVDEEEGPHFTYKYFGTISLISDRLYLMEMESLMKKNLSLTVLYPTYQPKLQFLNGINAGVASTHGRDPACRYITYEFLGKSINIRQALKSCALYISDSDKVSEEVKKRLKAKESPDPDIFFGNNYI
ncbi:MAG: helix-turn-helix transcriptional regulator [Amphritea sp.]